MPSMLSIPGIGAIPQAPAKRLVVFFAFKDRLLYLNPEAKSLLNASTETPSHTRPGLRSIFFRSIRNPTSEDDSEGF